MKKFLLKHKLLFGVIAFFLLTAAVSSGLDEVNDLWGRPLANRQARWSLNGPKPSLNSPWEWFSYGDVRMGQAGTGQVGHFTLTDDSVSIDWDSTVQVKVKDSLLITTSQSTNMNGSIYCINGHTNPAFGLIGRGNQATAATDTVVLSNAPNRAGTSGEPDKWIRIRFKATAGGADTIYAFPAVRVSP